MIQVTQIVVIDNMSIICELNNGSRRKIAMLPIIEQHQHINGVSKLKDSAVLKSAKIGEMGEIYWKNLVLNSKNEYWNYDISPEFVYLHGEVVD